MKSLFKIEPSRVLIERMAVMPLGVNYHFCVVNPFSMKRIHPSPKKALTIFIFFISCSFTLSAQCYPTGWQNATSFSLENIAGGDYNFSTPSNAQVSDNSRSSASALISILTGTTHYLKATGFNFNIPSYASICGVTVEIEGRATGLLLTAAVRDNQVRLIKSDVISGSNYAVAGDWGSADSYKQYGGAADLWGNTLTPADVNDGNFGVAISVRLIALVAALPSAEIDHVRMRIDYNPVLPVTLLYFKGEQRSNGITLQWKTTEEEEGATISLQRSTGQDNWEDLRQYDLHASNRDKEYTYTDINQEKGERQYRLHIKLPSGHSSYSATRRFVLNEKESLVIYPNPAKDILIANSSQVFLSDMMGRRLNLPVLKNGKTFSIQISSLAAGTYFVHSEKGVAKLIKE
jgi:hypothetical protein